MQILKKKKKVSFGQWAVYVYTQVVDRVSTLTSFVTDMSIGSIYEDLRDSVVKVIVRITSLWWAWTPKNLDKRILMDRNTKEDCKYMSQNSCRWVG